MLELLLLAIGVIGFGLAAYWDVKTTEFPDWLPYFIIVASLIAKAGFSFVTGNFSLLIDGIVIGVAFLAFGLLLYYTKQWGDGDAWLLGALGFVFPTSLPAASTLLMPLPVMLLFNFFFVAFFYLILYSLVVGIMSENTYTKFKKELKGDAKAIVTPIIVFAGAAVGALIYLNALTLVPLELAALIASLPVVFAALILFMRYGRFVENNLFRRKIPVSRLKVGDVPVGERWRVLTRKEVTALKKKGGHIWIKEGVRFAPVFIITLLLTYFYGNLFQLFLAL